MARTGRRLPVRRAVGHRDPVRAAQRDRCSGSGCAAWSGAHRAPAERAVRRTSRSASTWRTSPASRSSRPTWLSYRRDDAADPAARRTPGAAGARGALPRRLSTWSASPPERGVSSPGRRCLDCEPVTEGGARQPASRGASTVRRSDQIVGRRPCRIEQNRGTTWHLRPER